MLDLIASILIRFLNLIFHFIPISIVLAIGRRLAIIVYWVMGYRRRIGYTNLRAAFCKTKSPSQIKKMLKSMYSGMAEIFAEVLSLTKVNDRYVDHYIKLENYENFWRAYNYKKGVIFLTAHFGNWELSGMVSSLKGFPLTVLAREQKMKRLNALIDRLRESKGSKVVRKGITTRYIVKALHENKTIGMVGDQDAGKNGVFTNFFDRPASTAIGPFRFAARTGAVILPAFMVRLKGPYHKLVLERPIVLENDRELLPYIEEYNKLLESYVSEYYSQWLWIHRRWKSTPLKKIVILNDGKAGHLNQSLSIAESFKKYRMAKGISQESVQIEIIEIRFRNRLYKALINLGSIFSGRWCQGCLRCLKFALARSSYEKLSRAYADVVISTGFSLAGVNSIYGFENNAKKAVCMKPGFLGFKKFDMIILPRHDVKKTIKSKNVIVTDLVPTTVNLGYLEKMRKNFLNIVKTEKLNKVGVLLGGDNRDFEYTRDDVLKVLSGILEASRQLNADILFSTSRRTGNAIEELVKEKFNDEPSCKFLVIANEKNIPNAVGGILALSNVIVVSGESTSMVSEAVSSGKRTIVFKGRKKSERLTKHDEFLDRLKDAGYIEIAKFDNLLEVICNPPKEKGNSGIGKDEDWVYRNMWRLGG